MNRLALKQKIIDEGAKRGIEIKGPTINVQFDPISVFVTIVNDKRSTWVSKYQVENLIYDMMPVERFFDIRKIRLAEHHFEVDDVVEVRDLWFKRYEENNEEDVMIVSASGDWGNGWIRGVIVKIQRGVYGVQFDRPVYFGNEDLGFSNNHAIEKAVYNNRLKLVTANEIFWVGCCSWSIRKID